MDVSMTGGQGGDFMTSSSKEQSADRTAIASEQGGGSSSKGQPAKAKSETPKKGATHINPAPEDVNTTPGSMSKK
jgi:hypothetical protein